MIDVTRKPDRDNTRGNERSRYWFGEKVLPGGSHPQYIWLVEYTDGTRHMLLIDREKPSSSTRSKRVKRGRILKVARQLQREPK